MTERFITPAFKKLSEQKGYIDEFNIAAARGALKQLENAAKSIRLQEGHEEAERVLSFKTVKRALEQILSYYEDANTNITSEDHQIYYEYAYLKLNDADGEKSKFNIETI